MNSQNRNSRTQLIPRSPTRGGTSSSPISNRISVHRPRCRIELSIPGDANPQAEGAVLAASLTKIFEGGCCRVYACPAIVMFSLSRSRLLGNTEDRWFKTDLGPRFRRFEHHFEIGSDNDFITMSAPWT